MNKHLEQQNAAALPKNLFGYEVLDYIGQGAGSLIYVVSDPQSRQLYALKHVVCKTDKDQRFVEQLEAEYEVGRRVVDQGLRRSVAFKANKTFLRKTTEAALILELFDGAPLEQHRPDSVRAAVDVFVRTAKALEGLHRAGYVHCDLKPNNILVNSRGDVKVIDLGQACPISTVKSRIQGTPDYIAPEQVKCQEVTAKTDVYNFGATLYWALTAKNMPTLFTIKKGENSLLADGLIETPAQLNPRCPEPLSNLVMECTRVRQEKRPEMQEVGRRLEVIQYALQKAAQQPQTNVPQAAQRVLPAHSNRAGVRYAV